MPMDEQTSDRGFGGVHSIRDLLQLIGAISGAGLFGIGDIGMSGVLRRITGLNVTQWSVQNLAVNTVLASNNRQFVEVSAGAGPVLITLPPASDMGGGRPLFIFKSDVTANAVTIAAAGGDSINGFFPSVVLPGGAPGGMLLINSGGNTWWGFGFFSGYTPPAGGVSILKFSATWDSSLPAFPGPISLSDNIFRRMLVPPATYANAIPTSGIPTEYRVSSARNIGNLRVNVRINTVIAGAPLTTVSLQINGVTVQSAPPIPPAGTGSFAALGMFPMVVDDRFQVIASVVGGAHQIEFTVTAEQT